VSTGEDDARTRVEVLLAQAQAIEIGIGEYHHMGDQESNIQRGLRAHAKKKEDISNAWEEVIRAIAERLIQATSIDPAPSRSAASFCLVCLDQGREEKAKNQVEQARRKVEQIKNKIEEHEDEIRCLKWDLKEKEKCSIKAWEEVIRMVKESLEEEEAIRASLYSEVWRWSASTPAEAAAPRWVYNGPTSECADEGATGDAEGADEAAAMRPSGDAEGADEAAARRCNGLTSEEAPTNAAPRATHGYPHPVPVDPMRHPNLYAALRASKSGMHPDDEELGWVLAYRTYIPPLRMDYPWQSPASSRACPCVCHKTGRTEEERQQNLADPANVPSFPSSTSSSAAWRDDGF
jgi:hypothetical protein